MKNYCLLFICTSVLFLMLGCQAEKNVSVQTQTNDPARSAATTNQTNSNSTDNQAENKNASAVPKPTVTDDGDTKSIYTDLASEKCKNLESNMDDGGSYRGECKGIAGFKLEVLEGDLRQTINVIFPSGKKAELDFWSKVSSAFSAVGDKAEWRVNNKGENAEPYALIVRYNSSENPAQPEKNTSYLVVTKITKDTACITDVVNPSKDQNIMARKLADEAANKPCIE